MQYLWKKGQLYSVYWMVVKWLMFVWYHMTYTYCHCCYVIGEIYLVYIIDECPFDRSYWTSVMHIYYYGVKTSCNAIKTLVTFIPGLKSTSENTIQWYEVNIFYILSWSCQVIYIDNICIVYSSNKTIFITISILVKKNYFVENYILQVVYGG